MEDSLKTILSGSFDLETLPEVPSKVIRIFLCCTATDTEQERNVLVERVYLPMREYTREKYGLELQVVDPRWGTTDDWSDTSTDRSLSLEEIKRCQQLSVGPNFVALLGQRYGERSLPALIPEDDFELIRNTLRNHRNRETRDAPLLDQWYQKDCNALEPVYVLQEVTQGGIQKTMKTYEAFNVEPLTTWQEIRSALRRLLEKGLDYCILEGAMDEDTKQSYIMSDLEREITCGLLRSDDPDSTCQVFIRNIVDLKNYVTHPLAPRFMEILYNEKDDKLEIDTECETLLNNLKEEKLSRGLQEGNIHAFDVLWRYDDGINLKYHKPYLDELCNSFQDNICSLIDRIAHAQATSTLPHIVDEVQQHWNMCRQKCENFVGREDILDIIRSYIVSNSDKPLVLHGVSGSGKTSVMAKAAGAVSDWVECELITVVRFFGITAASFDVRQIIHGICTQLAYVMNTDPEIVPKAYKELQAYFLELLAQFPDDSNLVIFLDSLDMLVPQYNAHFLYWLPRQLKENVKIVVSTLPEVNNILHRLCTEVIQDENNFVEVNSLSIDECTQLLAWYLEKDGRCINHDQNVIVRHAFKSCALPFYVKLLFEDAFRWRSYTTVMVDSLPSNTKETIHSIFDRLEANHGKALVSRALAYLTASTTGLSDCEMEDILSLDDKVMAEVFPDWQPPTYRLPPIQWLRLKNDITNFLTRKECEGITVYYWNHRQFVEVTRFRYLNDESSKKEIHSYLADYVLGSWSQKKKPYKRPSSSNNNQIECNADRHVPTQPLTFQAAKNVTRFNRRKYEQVPRHLYLSGRLSGLNKLVLFNYEWLYNKTKALSLEHVLADFVLNPGVEATLVERALRDAQPFIAANIDNMAPEIVGRLLCYYTTHPHIRELIQQCDTAGLRHCALTPNFPYHQVPGSPLRYTIECDSTPRHFGLAGEDGRFILTKERSNSTIRVFDLATGEHSADVFTSIGDMYTTPGGRFVVVADHVTEKSIKVHSTDSGEFVGQLIPMNHIQMKPKEKYHMGKVSVSDTHVCVIVTTEQSYLCIADLQGCRFLQVLGLEGRATICQITPDSRYVFCNANENLLCYDLTTLEKLCTVNLDHRPANLIFTKDGSRGFIINNEENKITVIHTRDGSSQFMYKVVLTESFIEDRIKNLTLSNNQEMLLVQGLHNIIVYHIRSEQVITHFPRPSDIPKEFKLPRSYCMDIFFTQAEFSPDDKFVIGAIFRNVYIWQVANGRLLTTLQAPVGIISELLIPSDRGQIVTHLDNSSEIHVWSLGDAISHVGTLDRLTTAAEEIVFTSDDLTAFIRCEESDEIGVLDMVSGQLVDLLTHQSRVNSLSITPDGKYAFVSVEPTKPCVTNKIWYMEDRKIIYEFGNAKAFGIPMQECNSFICISQEENLFKAPYYVSQFRFDRDNFEEQKYEYVIKHVLCKPFMTPQDRYLVVLTADDYVETRAVYVNPTICAISLKTNVSMSTFSTMDLAETVKMKRILHIRPYEKNPYTVIALYTNEPDPLIDTGRPSTAYNHCYGFLIFDVCSGVVCQVIEDFLAPSTPMEKILFTGDVRFCLDNESNVFDMGTGYYIKRLHRGEARPRRLALEGKVAVYFEKQYLYAIRVADGKQLAHCNVHGDISCIEVCHNGRTIVVGCKDGAIISYILIDKENEDSAAVLKHLPSRAVPETERARSSLKSRSWDKIDFDDGKPPYSRPPSAISLGPTDKHLLQRVKPVQRFRPKSDTMLYINPKSKVCVVM